MKNLIANVSMINAEMAILGYFGGYFSGNEEGPHVFWEKGLQEHNVRQFL